MKNFKNFLKIWFDCVEVAIRNFLRKFGADQLSAIFQILLGKNHQYGVKGLIL
jgi:hypothetical protein